MSMFERFGIALSFLCSPILCNVADEIQAALLDMKSRRAEQDRVDMLELESRKAELRKVTAAAPTGNTCRMELPLNIAAAHMQDTEDNPDWVQQLIQKIWDDVSLSGHLDLPLEELAALDLNASHRVGCRPSTFGESVDDYEKAFMDPRFGLGPGDVHVDLGGGVGKAVMYAFLKYNISKGISVELSKTRFDRSCQALQRLQELLQSEAETCGTWCRNRLRGEGHMEMVHENMLDADLSQATVVTMWAACLPPETITELQRKMLRDLKVGTRVYERFDFDAGWVKDLVLGGKTFKLIGKIKDGGVAYRVEAHDRQLEATEL